MLGLSSDNCDKPQWGGGLGSRAGVEIKVEGTVGPHLMASGMSSEEESGPGVTGFLPIYGSGLLGASQSKSEFSRKPCC